MDSLPLDKPVTVLPMKAFPLIKDLVTDVSWNFRINKRIPPFQPRPDAEWKIDQRDVDRVQEFRKRSEEHTSELQSRLHLVCRLLLEKKKKVHTTSEPVSDSQTRQPQHTS